MFSIVANVFHMLLLLLLLLCEWMSCRCFPVECIILDLTVGYYTFNIIILYECLSILKLKII